MRIESLLETATASHPAIDTPSSQDAANKDRDSLLSSHDDREGLSPGISNQDIIHAFAFQGNVLQRNHDGMKRLQHGQPGKTNVQIGIRKRREWRSICRNRLSQHIKESLGIQVGPSEVRLVNGDDMSYAWQISDPSIRPLFKKPMSKHSVGAYMELYKKVGLSFWAVHSKDTQKMMDTPTFMDSSHQDRATHDIMDRTSQSTVLEQLQSLRTDSTRLLERLEQARARSNGKTWADTESQTEMLRSIIQDAQTMIRTHQRFLPS